MDKRLRSTSRSGPCRSLYTQQFRPAFFNRPAYFRIRKRGAQGRNRGHGVNDVPHRTETHNQQ
jgi:hypothetical protein